jgi:orotate phosphoribosyltransferase
MNSIILHISDLHVSLDRKLDRTENSHDSYLITNSDNELCDLYIEKFTSFVKEEIGESKIYLIITGDITDRGEEKEFKFALKFLNLISEKLKINKNNILLIPGDHDLNRRSLETLLAKNEASTLEEKNIVKFENFKTFYSEFLNKEFNPNKIIFDVLEVENKILFLGLNSSYKIDLEHKLGSISIDEFVREFDVLDSYEHLKKICCMHHNITSAHENKQSGQWDINNRKRLIPKLLEKNINFIFSGNEHTSSCKKISGNEITVSDAGAFSSLKYDCAFKIYGIKDGEDIVLTNKIYALQKVGDFEHDYYWAERINVQAKQTDLFEIHKKVPPIIEDEIIEIPSLLHENIECINYTTTENKIYYSEEFTDELYNKVKELKLYHSGHFHWSETSRAHNWIDVSKLIEDKENLNFVKNAIIDVINTKNLDTEIDLIIGLGYEGNIISSKSAIKYNKPYAFLPYSYRHDEHHGFENELNFDNSSKKYKNVLIITDVVNDGRTIRKLINKRQKTFFSNVEKVYVISLFYTGNSVLNFDILNFDFIKTIPNYDIENDEDVNNIEFYTVKSLKVEKCPFGKDFRESCLIVKDNLGCVNLFYDETKYLARSKNL